MLVATAILTADEAWVALASLHRRHPERESFSAKEIMESAKREAAHPNVRAGLQAHIYLHNVANVAPNSARYRMFFKVSGGTYRLFRPGDDSHPDRKGKMAPHREGLPAQYHSLLDWYEKEYSLHSKAPNDEDDPVLQMWGVGKEIWADEGGDAFIARERAAMHKELDRQSLNGGGNLKERVWERIAAHQGEKFHTITRLPFTYAVEGRGVWFVRNGRRIKQRLERKELDKAVDICPVSNTTEFAKLRAPSYLFGLLMDSRIRSKDW